MTRRLIFGFILLAASALTVGFWRTDLIPVAIAVALVGLAWTILHARNVTWISSWMFFVFTLASAAAIYAEVNRWLAFVAIVASLLAWDLTHFSRRLSLVRDAGDAKRVESAHYARLALIVGLGALGTFVAGQARVNLTFASAGVLAFLAVWGVSALISSLRKRE
jgi:hypothetical protein